MNSQNRREFLKSSAMGALGIALLSKYGLTACAQPNAATKSGIGLQLYTIRDAMSKDVAGSLKKVADIGYQYLELAGYNNGLFYGYTPAEFKTMVDDLGMKIISSHSGVEVKGVDTSNVEAMAEAHAELGVEYCVQPWLVEERRVSADSYRQFVAELNTIGEVELMTQFPGRFELWHIKDMEASEDQFFAPVGEGTMDYKEIMKVKDVAGMKYFFVEQDATRDGDAMQAIETSFNNLKKII
jgi:sugar phosphate isomerase/epimerase